MVSASGYALLCVFWTLVFFGFNLILYKRLFFDQPFHYVFIWLASWLIQLLGCSFLWNLTAGDEAILRSEDFKDFLLIFSAIVWFAVLVSVNLIWFEQVARFENRLTAILWVISWPFQIPFGAFLYYGTILMIIPD
jgi:hypothetical protein